jgi:cation diffusion facilitator family transporter
MSSLSQRASRGRAILLAGVLINLILAVVKMSAGWIGHSDALVADGLESTLDVLSSALIWIALKYAARPPDTEHPYGHGKMESLAGVGGALILLGAGAMVAVNSLREIAFGDPDRPIPSAFTLGILILVVLVKELLFRITSARNREVGSTALESDAWHHRSDALTSLAAAAGILVALIGGSRWVSADDWAALFSCAVIALNGLRMLRVSLGELLDEQAPAAIIQKIMDSAMAVPGVKNVEKCRVRKSGLTLLADLHVRVQGDVTVSAGHHISHLVKDALMAGGYHLSDVTVHIEPAQESFVADA